MIKRKLQLYGFAPALFVLSSWLWTSCAQKENVYKTMATSNNTADVVTRDTAVFGSGCFWCSEAIFQTVNGVLKVNSGYSGGDVANPTYEQVSEKNTGHVEVVEIVYNPSIISFDELLEIFWETHDPTTYDRQGNDVGPQYRSVVFYKNEAQRIATEIYKKELNDAKAFDKPIVTEITPFKNFYLAEKYHQNYFSNNGNQPYCNYVIRPKLEKFKKVFADKVRK